MPYQSGPRATTVAATVFALFLLGACTTPSAPPQAAAASSCLTDEYLFGAGDTVGVNVWRNENLNVQVPVRPDGKISMPLAGEIQVGDKTPKQVESDITQKLAEYIRDPRVTVIVLTMESAQYRCRVRVTGAVNTVTSLPYREGMTVLDVVLEAGGLTEFANPGKAVLFRANGERVPVDLRGILNRGDLSTNYGLAPGDVVTVPERAF